MGVHNALINALDGFDKNTPRVSVSLVIRENSIKVTCKNNEDDIKRLAARYLRCAKRKVQYQLPSLYKRLRTRSSQETIRNFIEDDEFANAIQFSMDSKSKIYFIKTGDKEDKPHILTHHKVLEKDFVVGCYSVGENKTWTVVHVPTGLVGGRANSIADAVKAHKEGLNRVFAKSETIAEKVEREIDGLKYTAGNEARKQFYKKLAEQCHNLQAIEFKKWVDFYELQAPKKIPKLF